MPNIICLLILIAVSVRVFAMMYNMIKLYPDKLEYHAFVPRPSSDTTF